jgi:hypothetical protein
MRALIDAVRQADIDLARCDSQAAIEVRLLSIIRRAKQLEAAG